MVDVRSFFGKCKAEVNRTPAVDIKPSVMKVCEECGKEFAPEKWELENPPNRPWLCGSECLYRHAVRMVPETCDYCDEPAIGFQGGGKYKTCVTHIRLPALDERRREYVDEQVKKWGGDADEKEIALKCSEELMSFLLKKQNETDLELVWELVRGSIEGFLEREREEEEETWCEECEECGTLMGGKVFTNEEEFDEYPDREPGYDEDGRWRCPDCMPKCCECGGEIDDSRHACIVDTCDHLTCAKCSKKLKLKDQCSECRKSR